MAENRVKATHGAEVDIPADPVEEVALAARLRGSETPPALLALYDRFAHGQSAFDFMMRRVLWRALARRVGDGLRIEPGAGFKHIETFDIGTGVFIGAQAYIQGRIGGRCAIGDRAWIGPQAYFDARDLVIGARVGWGPGAKVLGSAHVADPLDVPIIQTDLVIKPLRIGEGADIGVNAVILPGITVGAHSIVGAGAVVTKDVEPYAVVAGVPARQLRSRKDR